MNLNLHMYRWRGTRCERAAVTLADTAALAGVLYQGPGARGSEHSGLGLGGGDFQNGAIKSSLVRVALLIINRTTPDGLC